jgi:hypothetical protein
MFPGTLESIRGLGPVGAQREDGMDGTILVGTADGLHRLGAGSGVELAGREVKSLARSALDWWAVIDDAEVWRSSRGEDWERLAVVEGLTANCVLPVSGGAFIGTSEAHLFSLQEDRLQRVEAFEEVAGRSDWGTPWGGPPDVRSMSAGEAGTTFVNVHVGGISRSDNRGRSWEPTIEIDSDVHQVLFDRGSGLLLAACARGLADSGDGGDSWVFDSDGLHGPYLRAIAVTDETVLVSASTGPNTDQAAVYRRPVVGDQSFMKCDEGLPDWFDDNIDTACLAARGHEAAFGTPDGRVFASIDEGETWTAVAEGLPQIRCLALG